MQIQCSKCKAWTDDETGTCTQCGAVLYEPACQDAEQALEIANKEESQKLVVEAFLLEQKRTRRRTALRIICFLIAATCFTLGGLWVVDVLFVPGFMFLFAGIAIKTSTDSYGHIR